jgi:hypothetical protein
MYEYTDLGKKIDTVDSVDHNKLIGDLKKNGCWKTFSVMTLFLSDRSHPNGKK